MGAALRWCKDEAAGLDRARAQEDLPVRMAGEGGEGGRHGQKTRAFLGKRAVELWKTQVIADAQAQAAPGQLGCDQLLAWPENTRFPVALPVGNIDVEHVDLVIAGGDFAFGRKEEAAIG